MKQAPSQIIKQEFRTVFETQFYNRFSVFQNIKNSDENQSHFGNLLAFDEEIISPKQTINYTIDTKQTIIILPIVGKIDIKSSFFSGFVHTNQLQTFVEKTNNSFTISNPDPNSNVQLLQLRFKNIEAESSTVSLDPISRNQIKTLLKNDQFLISIGIFDPRKEAKYKLQNPTNGVFAFVLNGALEFQNRLLENRDGLKIWGEETIEMEALANQTIVLITEVSFS